MTYVELPAPHAASPSGKPRARTLPIPFEGAPGPNNAITDVTGVLVGHHTLIEGDGALVVGTGPIRTGVTAVLPRPHESLHVPVFAGFHSLNGNGEMTGTHWIEESGQLQWPITITNTNSCGIARDATVKWACEHLADRTPAWLLPVAAETYDGTLNDINGFHVTDAHVFSAIDSATSGPVEQGSVGGGTGMICYGFKGGAGTSSRLVEIDGQTFVVGVYLQTNFGRSHDLVIAGASIGRLVKDKDACSSGLGSVIAIVATDAPLLPHQTKRLARRVSLGLARSGTIGHDGSGDIFLAFSTTTPSETPSGRLAAEFLSNNRLDPLFRGVVEATHEAVIDSMIVNETMVGRDGIMIRALPHEAVIAALTQ